MRIPPTPLRVSNAILIALSISLPSHAAATSAILANTTVSFAFTAGPHAPHLDTIRAPGLSLRNQAEEPLPSSILRNAISLPLVWNFNSALSHTSPRVLSFVYESKTPHLRLTWQWELRASSGPIQHHVTVQNLDTGELWLPLLDSLRLDFLYPAQATLRNFYVEKGADTPSPQGTHLDTISDRYHWTGKSSTYAHPEPGEAREIIPFEFVSSADAPHAGWFAGIEFSGRTRIALERNGTSLRTLLGLNPDPGPFRTRILPGATFESPTIFLGASTGGPDGVGNQLRPWVRAVLGNPRTWSDPHYPLTVNNSWGSGMQVDEALALRMIHASKQLGLEMFHLDAGWFRGVGDWYPDPLKFPHGLAPLADAAHAQGLRFGLWVDWTQAGLDTEPGALNVRKIPDWLVTDLPPAWKPEAFKGQTVDLGVPAVHRYLASEVDRIVRDNHLDMLEHDGYLVAQGCMRDDHPHAPPDRASIKITHDSGFDFVRASNSTDVSYHAVRAYYDIYAQLRRAHPGLLFEICNDGGRMVDFGSAAHGDYFSITDTYDPLSNRRAFYDASFLLPPPMLESYVEKWPAPQPENFLYMLRSGMMGWFTLMQDTSSWTPAQRDTARQAIALYKEKLRPLLRDAQLYHVSARPDGVHWDAIEYWDNAQQKGVVYAFRGSDPNESRHAFALAGLNPAAQYKLHFEDRSAPDNEATGKDLMSQGLTVQLAHPYSSELVFLTASGVTPPHRR
ncbi:MAG: alpha-galactosidase [Terracidiphilus sp.]